MPTTPNVVVIKENIIPTIPYITTIFISGIIIRLSKNPEVGNE